MQQPIYEDEIDLKELLLTLYKNKKLIAAVTFAFTLAGIAYAFIKEPVYEVKAVLEVGGYKTSGAVNFVENPQNMIKRIELENPESIEGISLLKGTQNLVEIVTHAKSNEAGIETLKNIVDSVQKVHNGEIQNYKELMGIKINNLKQQRELLEQKQNQFEGSLATKFELISKIDDLNLQISAHSIQPTTQIGTYVQKDEPVEPKKNLIITVAFVTGLIFSIFLVFFIDFIKSFKPIK
jgi:LPS O-antigen subunit length determinant protein (WzzB/FepE family)